MLKVTRGLYALHKVQPLNICKRFAHYDPEHVLPDYNNLPSYQVTQDPKEWEFVERLLPKDTIPEAPTEKKIYPSGWKPQTVKPGTYPYHVERNRFHNIPVCLKLQLRKQKRHTVINNVRGDIHALAEELFQHLQAKNPKKGIGMRINEVSGQIRFMGDHVSNVQVWLEERNF